MRRDGLGYAGGADVLFDYYVLLRLRGGEGTEVDGDEAVYGVGCGVRYVSSAGSGRLLLWVIEDPRKIPAQSPAVNAPPSIRFFIPLSGRYSLSWGWDRRQAGRGTMAAMLAHSDPKESPTASGRRRVEIWRPLRIDRT